MELLQQALALVNRDSVDLDTLNQYNALLDKAKGEEVQAIGDLYTSLISKADEDVYAEFVAAQLERA